MMIRYAGQDDLAALAALAGCDRHIREDELRSCIDAGRVLLAFDGAAFIGWLRFNLFWDEIPFLNMLFLLDGYRGKGYGGELVRFWEQEMRKAGHRSVLVSTLSSEQGQHFFRKNGYIDCGSLLLPGEPLEIILRKDLA